MKLFVRKLRMTAGRLLRIKPLVKNIREFGLVCTIRKEFISIYKGDLYRQEVVFNYYKKLFADVYASGELTKDSVSGNVITSESCIWVCWWQGVENMPPIVKVCYDSILRNAGPHKVQLITSENYKSFVDIPDYILKKVELNLISITHLSDIIRMSLLAKHGGLWMDATLLITSPIDVINKRYFSLKSIPENNSFYWCSNYRWTTYCLGGGKNNSFFIAVKRMLLLYWKKHDVLLDYFMFDYCMEVMYHLDPEIKLMVDESPQSNPCKYLLLRKLNEKYDEFCYENLTTNTQIHKLTYKKNFNIIDEDGDLTYYGYILNKYNTVSE